MCSTACLSWHLSSIALLCVDPEDGDAVRMEEGEEDEELKTTPPASQGFDTVEEVGWEDGGGGESSSEGDPWSRIGELPESLGEKLLELREEGCVCVCVCVYVCVFMSVCVCVRVHACDMLFPSVATLRSYWMSSYNCWRRSVVK